MQVLLNEITAYIWLVRLWSKHVPRLLYWGTTCNGSVLVLATELLTDRFWVCTGRWDWSDASRKKEKIQAAARQACVPCGSVLM